MDFAETFTCTSAEELQSAYWNSSAVTLHPVVTSYRAEDGTLTHDNYVFVSDYLGHNFGTVFAILDQLMHKMKMKVPFLKTVYYWTDSPSSHYRNKSSFYIVSDHENVFRVNAVWNFFESGHGKGPCDGIGGTSKRTADLAIKQGKITVQDACYYFDKVQQYHTSAEYVFVKSEDCTTKRESLTEINRNLQPVKGTMQIHCVIGMEKGIIATSTTSCYCSDCLEAKCHNTSKACLLKKSIQINMACESVENETANETEPEHLDGGNVLTTEDNIVDEIGLGNRSLTLELKVCNYVAACYDKDWFIGKILEIDEEDGELLITFLQPCKKTLPGTRPLYKWPTNEILCNVSEPSKHGRSGRSFEISQEDFKTATEIFALKMMTK